MTTSNHELYSQMTVKALVEAQKKIKVLYDYEFLAGDGIKFYVNVKTKQMVPITAGKLITRITDEADKYGKHIVYAENQEIYVPESDIVSVGFN